MLAWCSGRTTVCGTVREKFKSSGQYHINKGNKVDITVFLVLLAIAIVNALLWLFVCYKGRPREPRYSHTRTKATATCGSNSITQTDTINDDTVTITQTNKLQDIL